MIVIDSRELTSCRYGMRICFVMLSTAGRDPPPHLGGGWKRRMSRRRTGIGVANDVRSPDAHSADRGRLRPGRSSSHNQSRMLQGSQETYSRASQSQVSYHFDGIMLINILSVDGNRLEWFCNATLTSLFSFLVSSVTVTIPRRSFTFCYWIARNVDRLAKMTPSWSVGLSSRETKM